MVMWIYPDEVMPGGGELCLLALVGPHKKECYIRLGVFDGNTTFSTYPNNGAHYERSNVVAWSKVTAPYMKGV